MPRRTPIRLLLLGCLVSVPLLGYLLRMPLLLAAVNFLLAGTPLSLVGLQGLDLARSRLQVQQVDLLLPATGQTLVITDLALSWRSAGALALPQPEALRIGTASLGAPAPTPPAIPATVPATDAAPLDVAGLLLVLRDFPLASIEVGALTLPQRAAPVSVSVVATAGNFAAEASSAGLGVALTLVQPDATAAAQLLLQVAIDEDLAAALDFTMPPGVNAGEVSGSGSFDARGRWKDEPFSASGSLVLPPCQVERSAQCALQFNLAEATLAAWTSATDTAEPIHMEGLVLGGNGMLGFDAQALQWQLSDAAFQGTLAALETREFQFSSAFSLRDVELTSGMSADDLTGSLQFSTDGLVLVTPQPWLPAVDLEGSLLLSGQQVDFDSAVRFRDGAVPTDLRIQGRHDLARAAGTATVELAALQLAEGSTLGQRLGPWPFIWDLVLGDIDADLQLQWQDEVNAASGELSTRLTGSVAATLAGVAGYYGSSLFHGLATTFTGDIDTAQPLLIGTPPLELRLAGLDVGLPLLDLVLQVQLDAASNSLLIESLTGAVLGGSIAMQQQRYAIGETDNALTLQFNGLRLEQVLSLTGYDDISVDGGISGEVPVRFSANGIEVVGGSLRAQQPGGSIRYLGTLGEGDASLALVRQALSNYRFDVLESSIDYSPDGELLLRMQLQGFNPELENGRRVNLNLNLSDDVPALLQSLQAGRAIEDLLQELYE